MTPITFPSERMGALSIFWMDSGVSELVFTPSKTAACRATVKLLSISGRLSRAVRAARAELLERGMNPTFFRASGTRKWRWRQRVETPMMATSSFPTERVLAIFSATEVRENCDALPSSAFKAVAMRSSSVTRPAVELIWWVSLAGSGGSRGSARQIPSVTTLFSSEYMRYGKKISKRLCLPKEQSNLHHLQQLPILISPRFLSALPVSLVANWSRLTRRRGHVRNGNPA